MRRCGAKRAGRPDLIDYRNGERRALDGVGSDTEFVEKYERSIGYLVHYRDDIDHVRAESRKRRLDALFVAYIGEHSVENADRRMLVRRYMKPCLRHERKQSERFERNRFTAGVRAGYDERIVPFAERNVYRHDLVFRYERMPCSFEVDNSFFSIYFGADTLYSVRKFGAGESIRYFGYQTVIRDERR